MLSHSTSRIAYMLGMWWISPFAWMTSFEVSGKGVYNFAHSIGKVPTGSAMRDSGKREGEAC